VNRAAAQGKEVNNQNRVFFVEASVPQVNIIGFVTIEKKNKQFRFALLNIEGIVFVFVQYTVLSRQIVVLIFKVTINLYKDLLFQILNAVHCGYILGIECLHQILYVRGHPFKRFLFQRL